MLPFWIGENGFFVKQNEFEIIVYAKIFLLDEQRPKGSLLRLEVDNELAHKCLKVRNSLTWDMPA